MPKYSQQDWFIKFHLLQSSSQTLISYSLLNRVSFKSCSFIKLFLKLYTLKKLNDFNVWILLALHPSSISVLISNNHKEFFVVRRESYLINNASYIKLYFLFNLNASHVIKLSFVDDYFSRWGSYCNCVSIKRSINTCNPGIAF